MPDRLLYRPTEAAEALGISKAMLYKLLAAGEIESVKVGRARRISRAALETFVAQRAAAPDVTEDVA